MLGVWQGIPFLFADFMRAREKKLQSYQEKNNQSYQKHYRLFLIYIALIPLILLFFQKPVWIIITYAIIGSLFMPFLAFTLYWLNNKRNTSLKNPKYINVLLWVAFLLFIVLMFIKIKELLM
ncbi:MAG: hypothetical protein GQ527_09075 [Bacteroidales bacterium]|nr:hypothetical protein [Bacteroidales bacterium]